MPTNSTGPEIILCKRFGDICYCCKYFHIVHNHDFANGRELIPNFFETSQPVNSPLFFINMQNNRCTYCQSNTNNGKLDNHKAFQRGILEWRNTPKARGKSPAELLYGCQMRSVVPSLQTNLCPWKSNIERKNSELQEKSEEYYNIGAKDLSELSVGDKVRVQDSRSRQWIEQGVISRKGRHQDYYVELSNGRTRWRNRIFLRPIASSSGEEEDSCVVKSDTDIALPR